MLELPHVLMGATIATKIPNPLISLPLAFLSHFILDLIPHWNPSLYTETKKYGRPTRKSIIIIMIDAFTSLILGLTIASQFLPDTKRFLIVVFACFLAVSPDLVEAPYFFLNFRPQILKRLILWQHDHQGRAKKIPGLLIQLATIIILLILLA